MEAAAEAEEEEEGAAPAPAEADGGRTPVEAAAEAEAAEPEAAEAAAAEAAEAAAEAAEAGPSSLGRSRSRSRSPAAAAPRGALAVASGRERLVVARRRAAAAQAAATEEAEAEAAAAEAAAAEAAAALAAAAEAQDALEAEGQAAAREAESDVTGTAGSADELDRCICRGNCGWKVCKRVQNAALKKKRKGDSPPALVCPDAPRPGGSYCARCGCEEEGCDKPRLARCERRWCSSHGRQAKPWKRQTDWSLELNLVARVAPVLRYLAPDDISCLTQLGRVLGGAPGTQVRGLEFFFLFLGHAVKWPPLVRMLSHRLREHGLVPLPHRLRQHGLVPARPAQGATQDLQDTEQDFQGLAATVLNILRDLLAHAEEGGSEWEAMFGGWRVSTLDICTGLGPLATDLGLLAPSSQSTASRPIKLGITTSMITRLACDYYHAFMIRDIIITLWRHPRLPPCPGSRGGTPGGLPPGEDAAHSLRRSRGEGLDLAWHCKGYIYTHTVYT